ncbi:hypothetical protein OKW98_18685 [Pseudomonas sp. KU26590]|uniref:hypothetical protein n=1 Tax=Pseudomonas sp. KU26590 TaxID=2991051 RepID=UPI00223DF68C|nr:hypothetical protein [Pseudomonas sp. KU26590]UZJ58605.1 hypothetical protein OKW98_18685 [Pseudomonas sp. KU26590]
MPSPKNHQEAYSNIYHMQQSIDRLLVASKDWKPEDAARGEKTLMRLELQIAQTKAELQLNR